MKKATKTSRKLSLTNLNERALKDIMAGVADDPIVDFTPFCACYCQFSLKLGESGHDYDFSGAR